MSTWDGKPPQGDWHWLIRRRDGELRMAHYSRFDQWRVADAGGRTVLMSESKVGRLFAYGAVAEPPTTMLDGRLVPSRRPQSVDGQRHG